MMKTISFTQKKNTTVSGRYFLETEKMLLLPVKMWKAVA